MVLMPAVVFTLFHAVETEPLPFGSIFFVALLVTFVVLRRAACESRPVSRLKLRHGQHLRYPGQRPATQHDVTGGFAAWDFSTFEGSSACCFSGYCTGGTLLTLALGPFIGLRPSPLAHLHD